MGRNLISVRDLSRQEILEILEIAEKYEELLRNEGKSDEMQGKVMGSLFFEPSTRTRLSFETAMKRLGGEVIGFSSKEGTSLMKGESFLDTVRVVAKYCDLMVIRHPCEGAARLASEHCNIPVINAGDGANQHPTQALLDLYTIRKLKGSLKGLRIALVGDLKHARAIRSLFQILSLFKATIFLVSPPELSMREEEVEEALENGAEVVRTSDLEGVLDRVQFLYVVRIQKERFLDPIEYERVKRAYRITREMVENRALYLLHPLPRVDELDRSIDGTEQAKYFTQAFYGVPVRMAVIRWVM